MNKHSGELNFLSVVFICFGIDRRLIDMCLAVTQMNIGSQEQPPRSTHLPIHSSHEIFKNSTILNNLPETSHFHKKSSQKFKIAALHYPGAKKKLARSGDTLVYGGQRFKNFERTCILFE